MPKPVIDQNKCTLCGTCVDICPMKVFESKEDKIETPKEDECIGCRACEVQCPKNAIEIKE